MPRPRMQLALLLGVMGAIQAVQGWGWHADSSDRSYWLITYRHGFVRRGLAGELLHLVPGLATFTGLLVVLLVVGLASAAALVVLAVRVGWLGALPAVVLAVAVMGTPAGVDFLWATRRPDQLGLIVLVLTTLVLTSGAAERWWVLAALGVAWAAITLIHEGGLLTFGVFVVPVVLILTRSWRDRVLRAALLLLPALAAALAVVLWGRASAGQVADLLADGSALATPGSSIVNYLDDSLADSWALVGRMPMEGRALMLGTGVVLLTATGALVTWATRGCWRGGDRGAWVIGVGSVLAAYLVIFATGVDWGRWFAAASVGVLVVAAAVRLREGPAAEPVAPPWWLWAAGIALALLPLYPGFQGPGFS